MKQKGCVLIAYSTSHMSLRLTQLLNKEELQPKPWRYLAKGFFDSDYEWSPEGCAELQENEV